MANKKPQHIELKDVDGTGILKEVVVMKRWDNGSYSYIETALLDNVDKGRLKGIITNQFSDKYEAWELCAQTTLSNGMNALDYFHQLARHHQEKGGTAPQSVAAGLGSVAAIRNAAMIGSEFTNPGEAQRTS
jgi:hypothetical protein